METKNKWADSFAVGTRVAVCGRPGTVVAVRYTEHGRSCCVVQGERPDMPPTFVYKASHIRRIA
jgi:hypothetical protein